MISQGEGIRGLRRKLAVAYQWFTWNGEQRRFKAVMRSPASPAECKKTFQYS
jgi:hypothetical protein